MSVVTLAQASTIVDTALKKGRETNCAPLTVAVLDAGGHLVDGRSRPRSSRSACWWCAPQPLSHRSRSGSRTASP